MKDRGVFSLEIIEIQKIMFIDWNYLKSISIDSLLIV